jgi:GNAT superfamily N-acetyltransferase
MSIKSLAVILNQTPEELIDQADLHTRAVQGWLSSRAPAATCFEGVGVRATSTGLPIPLLNLVLSKNYPSDTSDETIIHEIKTLKTFFAERNVPWYWWLGPNHSPPHLVQLLEQHGLALDHPPLPAMIAPLPSSAIGVNHDVNVWLATTRSDLEAASRIRHSAFHFPEGAGLDYFEAMASDWLCGNPARLFLACVNGHSPAAMGALIVGNGLPGIYVMATFPEWRKHGLGKAILSRILSEAAREGHRFIVLTASSLGYPLYQQFGFERIFDYMIYRLASAGH